MVLDLHIHQNKHSLDSKLNMIDAINDAKALNIDGICITDHDDLGFKPYAKQMSQAHDILIIVGVEIYTLDGDLLCYGIDKMPDERMTAQATIDFVHRQGGVCIAAHPYRKNNRGLRDKIYEVDGLDAVEGYNGRTDVLANLKAVEVARQMNLPITGGSDAHEIGEVGKYATHFSSTIKNEQDFLKAIRSRDFQAVSLDTINIERTVSA